MFYNKLIYRLAILGAIVVSFAPRLIAQERAFNFKGFVDTYHAMAVEQNNALLSSRTRLRAELEQNYDRAKAFVSFNANYNALEEQKQSFELREAYLDYKDNHWSLRLGRQFVLWGNADGVRITDLISSMDMREFLAQDYDDIRTPVNALRFNIFNDKLNLETVIVPKIETFRFALNPNSAWFPFKGQGAFAKQGAKFTYLDEQPKTKLSNIEVGTRLKASLAGLDCSLSALYTWNKMPIFSFGLLPNNSMFVRTNYYRMGVIGADFSKPLGEFVLRGEGAYKFDKAFQTNNRLKQEPERLNSLHYLVGLDWYAPNDWFVSAQFSSERIFNYNTNLQQEKRMSLATLNVSKQLLDNTLKLSNFLYFDLNNSSLFNRLALDYALTDQIHLFFGADYFGKGNGKGMFARFKDNSEIWLKARYSF